MSLMHGEIASGCACPDSVFKPITVRVSAESGAANDKTTAKGGKDESFHEVSSRGKKPVVIGLNESAKVCGLNNTQPPFVYCYRNSRGKVANHLGIGSTTTIEFKRNGE